MGVYSEKAHEAGQEVLGTVQLRHTCARSLAYRWHPQVRLFAGHHGQGESTSGIDGTQVPLFFIVHTCGVAPHLGPLLLSALWKMNDA